MSPPQLPDHAETAGETIAALRAAGWAEDFYLDGAALSCRSGALVAAPPEEFDMVADYRYEGVSDPDDSSIVLALWHRPTGTPGNYEAAYGPDVTADDGELLRRVRDARSR